MTAFCRPSDLTETIRHLRAKIAALSKRIGEMAQEIRQKDLEIAELTRLNLQREHMLAAVIRPDVSEHDSHLGNTQE